MTRNTWNANRVKQFVLPLSVVAAQGVLAGCGGTSQDDMRRHAIRRPGNETTQTAANLDEGQKRQKVPKGQTPSKSPEDMSHAVDSPIGASQEQEGVGAVATLQSKSEDGIADQQMTGSVEALPSVSPPAQPLSAAERRARAAANVTRIGEAWNAYLDDKGYFPASIQGAARQPLLSWRVELLPYLGLQSLYDAFRLDEAWDSPHNKALLEKIPDVYQSPERFDTRTNYLALSLSGATVYQERRRLVASKVEDGLENTLALVEVDDELAVPWTKPEEHGLAMGAPLRSLGILRETGLFVVWSDGRASWIDSAVDPALFAKACTIDSGDGFLASQIAQEVSAAVAVSNTAVAIPAESGNRDEAPPHIETASVPNSDAAPKPRTLHDAQSKARQSARSDNMVPISRVPVPSRQELNTARELLRDLYREDYANAKTAAEHLRLARTMLSRLKDLGADSAGQYALLDVSKQIAIQAGSVDVALDATDQLALRFEVERDALIDTFEKLARTAHDRREQSRLVAAADGAFDDLVLAEEYEQAERLSQLAVSAANKVNDQEGVDRFTVRRQWASEARRLRQAAEEAFAALEKNPAVPQANGDVGKFLCLIKGDWQNGIVILANGSDRSLKRLAEMELGDLSGSLQQLELADLWWREAESSIPAFKATIRERAKYWYELALPGLPAGLVRLRVERRIDEIKIELPRKRSPEWEGFRPPESLD